MERVGIPAGGPSKNGKNDLREHDPGFIVLTHDRTYGEGALVYLLQVRVF